MSRKNDIEGSCRGLFSVIVSKFSRSYGKTHGKHQSSGREMKAGPPEYQAGVLTPRSRFPALNQEVTLELMHIKRRRVSLLNTAF